MTIAGIKKVAFVTDCLNLCGGDRLMMELVKALDGKALKTSIFTISFEKKNFFNLPDSINVSVYNCWFVDLLNSLIGRLTSIFTCLMSLLAGICFIFSSSNKNTDLVLLNATGFLIIPLLKLFRYKVLFYCHFPESLALPRKKSLFNRTYNYLYRCFEEFCLIRADLILANSNFTMNTLFDTYKSIQTKVKLNPNFVNILYPSVDEAIKQVQPIKLKIADRNQINNPKLDDQTEQSNNKISDIQINNTTNGSNEISTIQLNDQSIYTDDQLLEDQRPQNDCISEMISKLDTEIGQNCFVITTVNRFVPYKNLELAITTFKKFKDMFEKRSTQNDDDAAANNSSSSQNRDIYQIEKTVLLLAGGYNPKLHKNYMDKLEELSSELGVSNSVIFLKSVPDKVIDYVFSKTDLMLYTSVNEHFGIVPVEAMYFKIPTIAVNSGGPTETIVDDQTGFLCENDSTQFAEKIYHLYSNRTKLLEFGQAAYRRYYQHFSHEIFLQKFYHFLSYLQ